MQAAGARRAAFAAAAMVLAAGVSACGSKSSVSSGSGKGRPPVTVGYRDTPEQAVVGELYAQSLRDKGYSVRVKPDFPDARAIDAALRSSQIDVYPEYTGVIAQVIGRRKTHYRSAESTYNAAKEVEERRGLTLLEPSKYSKNRILIARTTVTRSRGFVAIRALRKKLRNDFTLGGPPELRNNYDGLVGLRRAYDVIPRFKPLAPSRVYGALNKGEIDVAAVFATDPQMLSRRYRALGDKLKIFGFQNVAPVVSRKTLRSEGAAFTTALNGVTERLGKRAIRRLNSQVQTHHRRPADVARRYLAGFERKDRAKRAKRAKKRK